MDPGTKLVVLIAGLGLLVGGLAWLWRRFIGVEKSELPKDWLTEQRPGEGSPGGEHLND